MFFALIISLALHAPYTSSIPSTWITSHRGSCPVVISSPHGGSIKPSSIADRQYGCMGTDGTCIWEKNCAEKSPFCRAVTGSDTNTLIIANRLVHALVAKGCIPYFVASNLHRSKLDPNRDLPEAAQQDPEAGEAWGQYHSALRWAREKIQSQFSRGIVFDIHGQAHAENWTEIGTLIPKATLNAKNYTMKGTSLEALGRRSKLSPFELTYGSHSFGGMLASKGYKVVPSPEHNSPGNGGFFSGGFITQTYGSRDGGEVDAIQVEITRPIRLDRERYTKMAKDLSDTILEFLKFHNY